MGTPQLIEYQQVANETWRRLADCADDRSHPMRLVSMCSVDESGRPAARLMGIRGVDPGAGLLWFYSDRRAGKMEQLRRTPAVALVAYDPRDAVQLRIAGEAGVHLSDHVAERHWEQITMAADHVSWLSEIDPESAGAQADPKLSAMVESARHLPTGTGRDSFGVIEVRVDEIEWLQVSGNEQRCAKLRRENGWTPEPVSV